MRSGIFFLATLVGLNLWAQQGDKGSETQTPRVPRELIPPAPPLPPEQALKSYRIQPGFRIELVAAEPLVHDPIQIAFDPDGRLWVLEMRGYMPNIEGAGELKKVGSVVVLEDTDGDGRMDKRTVFLDGLVMPRAQSLARNPHYRNAAGANAQLYDDKAVWPARVNPGVNRGYRPGQLRPDGTLATFTAACAPLVYRGDNFPDEFLGNVFVCEPAGNLIKRYLLENQGVSFRAKNACGKSEFLASTDERFQPVNLNNGPDGCLYVVDMYHGILQHRIYVTSYLRQQILDRGLDHQTAL